MSPRSDDAADRPVSSSLLAQSCLFCLNCQTDPSFGRIFRSVILSNDDKTFQNSQVCAFRKIRLMNARVFLLALVTAAFMAIWDADRPSSVAAELSRAPQDNTAASDSATATSDALIPLPMNLQPGTWHAISRNGDTLRITIERHIRLSNSASTDAVPSEGPEKNFCVITAPDGLRWCFIKEHPKTVQETGAVQR